jgi:hypothetical protein
MSKPNYNEVFERMEDDMIDAGKETFIPGFGTEARQEANTPKQVKGGIFAPSDIELIKRAVSFYSRKSMTIEDWEERQIANLLHRLNNRT